MTLYSVYKTINKINQKEYIGFHKIQEGQTYSLRSETGSAYSDGYMGSGKLIKRAIAKYGPENFTQEVIFVSEDKQEALDYEGSLADDNYVLRKDTYNVVVGGRTPILSGEQNGFFGKTHTAETVAIIQAKRAKTYEETPFGFAESYLVGTDIKFVNHKAIFEHFGIPEEKRDKNFVRKLVFDGVIQYKSDFLQKKSIAKYQEHLEWLAGADERKAIKSRLVSERFKGVPKSPEANAKRGKSIKSWIEENPEKHASRMEKINKNPEKIRKTAEKHRGMKRSEEARRNMSEAQKRRKENERSHNFGLKAAYNKELDTVIYLNESDELPQGYVLGGKPRRKGWKWYNKDGNVKKFYEGDDIPFGWNIGRK